MHKQAYYINGLGNISPQHTFDNTVFLPEIQEYHENVLSCITPDFKQYINPIQLRRLSRLLRIGLSSATICLRDSSVSMPQGIITATGYGFLGETFKFLNEILSQQESQLTPTYFMQSTYNALAGLVALSIKCEGYNNTFVSRGFAFENALTDAMLKINGEKDSSYLVGTYDDAAPVQYIASQRHYHYKKESGSNLALFETPTRGTVQGEGSTFFMLSGNPSASTWCILHDMDMLFQPADANELQGQLTDFLSRHDLQPADIDVWIDGASGDVDNDKLLATLHNYFTSDTVHVRFKHLCGEYCTAAAFGTWLGASLLKKQHIPDIVKVRQDQPVKKIQQVLIVNQYMNTNYSFQLLEQYT